MTAPVPLAPDAAVHLLVKGFSPMEHRLLEATVQLSHRRPPIIELVPEAQAHAAEVVLLDALDRAVLHWAATQPWLAERAVIWAGAKTVRAGHVAVERQLKWPILQVLLYRALEAALAGRAATPIAAPEAAHARRVLVVDDSAAVRGYLRSLLEREGVEVHEADCAQAGIDAARATRFACVLLDVLMPGTDGFEACRQLKSRAQAGQRLPVVMLTSKSSPFDRVRGKMAGCDTYLTKPVDPAQLRDVLARHVVLRGGSRATVPPPSTAAALPASRVLPVLS